MNLSLYEIDQAYQLAQGRADTYAAEHDGEMLPEHWQELDALEMSRDAKIENSIKWYKNELALADMIDAELDALKARAKAHWTAAERTRAYMANLIKPGEKQEYGCGKIGWRGSDSVEVPDINALPEQYIKVERSARLLDIRAALKRGEILPVTLMHHDNLQIR